jgi:hypothetical protein
MGRRHRLGRGDTGAVGHRWPVGRSGRELHRRRRLGWAGPHRTSGVPALPARARSGVADVLAGSAAYGVQALDTFEHLADRLTADAGLGDPPTPARADRISTDALARIKRDLDTIGLIGSQHTVVLTNQIVADFDILAARMRHQARCGDEPMKDLNDELDTLRNRIWELRAQFRTDLAIPP